MYCNQQYSLCSIISVIASIINTLLICMHLNRKKDIVLSLTSCDELQTSDRCARSLFDLSDLWRWFVNYGHHNWQIIIHGVKRLLSIPESNMSFAYCGVCQSLNPPCKIHLPGFMDTIRWALPQYLRGAQNWAICICKTKDETWAQSCQQHKQHWQPTFQQEGEHCPPALLRSSARLQARTYFHDKMSDIVAEQLSLPLMSCPPFYGSRLQISLRAQQLYLQLPSLG